MRSQSSSLIKENNYGTLRNCENFDIFKRIHHINGSRTQQKCCCVLLWHSMVKRELQDILAGGLCPVFLGYECPGMVQWTLQWIQFGAVARSAIRSQSNWTSAIWDGASHPGCSGGKMGWNLILGRLHLYFVHMMRMPFSGSLYSDH